MNTHLALPPFDPETACVLLGHSEEEFVCFCGDSSAVLAAYQQLLYPLIDEQLNKGIRAFLAPLLPGIPLWLAEYVIKRRDEDPGMGIQIHIVQAMQETSPITPLREKVLSHANSIVTAHGNEYFDMYYPLLHHAGNLLLIEHCPGISLEIIHAKRLNMVITEHSLVELREGMIT